MPFLGMYWGENNNPARADDGDDGWRLETIPVDRTIPSHDLDHPDDRARLDAMRRGGHRYADTPIRVKPRGFGGYRVHDGNARLALARERGQHTIRAWVQR